MLMPTNYHAETLLWMHNLWIGLLHERARLEQQRLQRSR